MCVYVHTHMGLCMVGGGEVPFILMCTASLCILAFPQSTFECVYKNTQQAWYVFAAL